MKWRIILVPFAFAVVIFTRLVARWKVIRFGEVWTSRLGHLVGNTECYLGEKHPDTFDIFHFQKQISNTVIADKYRRILHVWPRWFGEVVWAVNQLFEGWQRHIAASDQFDRDIYNTWGKPHLTFSNEEMAEGRALTKQLGIPIGKRWVCLIVRDSAYMKANFPDGDFSYHDFRDAHVEDYMSAALELADRGYYVLRMGKVTEKPLRPLHNKIIDYANHDLNSDFGTLYLGAFCDFCIGTSTGFMAIPQVFKRPCAVTDFVPIEYISTFSADKVIWKHHWKDGLEMTFQEIIESGAGRFLKKQDFDAAGINLRNNTPAEITELALEMVKPWESDQTDFWAKFPRSTDPFNHKPLHGQMLARVGGAFYARLQDHRTAGHQGAEPRQAAAI